VTQVSVDRDVAVDADKFGCIPSCFLLHGQMLACAVRILHFKCRFILARVCTYIVLEIISPNCLRSPNSPSENSPLQLAFGSINPAALTECQLFANKPGIFLDGNDIR
jgi:hypothetical protein